MHYILGISCFSHNSSACLLADGAIVAAVQQERFSRRKYDPAFPADAIRYCLAEADITVADLAAVAIYDKPVLRFNSLLQAYMAKIPAEIQQVFRSTPAWLKDKLALATLVCRELDRCTADSLVARPKLFFCPHHQAQAASAFYPSPYREAAVICLDGSSELVSSTIWQGKAHTLTPLFELQPSNSLGLFYAAITRYLGFKVNSGEYKLMGLAPFGEPRFVETIYRELIALKADGSFTLNRAFFAPDIAESLITSRFQQLFGAPPLSPQATPSQLHLDLACSVQQVIEEVVLKLAKKVQQLTGAANVCLAGSVALNSMANGRLLRAELFKNIWVQPAAGEAGGALGAALLVWHQHYQQTRATDEQHDQMQGSYLGPAYSDTQIRQLLEGRKISYQKLDDNILYHSIAGLLAAGQVVGWFQGRMEFGGRALGNRSILADARSTSMQHILNSKIKQRESFWFFAAAVLAEHAGEYFDLDAASPYMLMIAKLNPELCISHPSEAQGLAKLTEHRSNLQPITDVAYSARIQTVSQQSNPIFHHLLQTFNELTATPLLINTSFNSRGEPPVCSPADALQVFLDNDIDYLVMGNYVVSKLDQPLAG